MYVPLAVLAGFLVAYSVVAARLERTPISGPMVATGTGIVLGLTLLGEESAPSLHTLGVLAELTLALVLFRDAAGVDLRALARIEAIPLRLLLVGMPLTLAAGFLVGLPLLPELTWVELGLLATMLAPTDAALGQAVLDDPDVPEPLRDALNVESGLNDGIAVPFLLLGLALSEHGLQDTGTFAAGLFAQVIGVGAVVGVLVTLVGRGLLQWGGRRGWVDEVWRGVAFVALPLCAFGTAQALGGSGFIACFLAGVTLAARTSGDEEEEVLQEPEEAGSALSMVTWVVFGAILVVPSLRDLDGAALLYALLSLTVIRVLPAVLSLTGLGLSLERRLFLGWFGPRGLATIVFAMMVTEADLPGGERIVTVAMCAVLLSVILHGLTAHPWAQRFARS